MGTLEENLLEPKYMNSNGWKTLEWKITYDESYNLVNDNCFLQNILLS